MNPFKAPLSCPAFFIGRIVYEKAPLGASFMLGIAVSDAAMAAHATNADATFD
ncbi:hypothetical protein [Pseudomonas sp. FP2309]|uniref:hypothetical protein n=1 Tax=Pseudomonas sp. FP2309 TaxID=2954091 RepID=UPI0027333D8F|nr:hypothetical protein [Pseudomonas sp. FP2309]WLH66738.1 hypothetical protein PSH59_16515 [Pseudomonas sp. FP2309]